MSTIKIQIHTAKQIKMKMEKEIIINPPTIWKEVLKRRNFQSLLKLMMKMMKLEKMKSLIITRRTLILSCSLDLWSWLALEKLSYALLAKTRVFLETDNWVIFWLKTNPHSWKISLKSLSSKYLSTLSSLLLWLWSRNFFIWPSF